MLRSLILTLATPKYPHLVSNQTAKYLFDDLVDRNKMCAHMGTFVSRGQVNQCCLLCLPENEGTSVFALTVLCSLARWAGQEGILAVRDQHEFEVIPAGAEEYASDVVSGERSLFAFALNCQERDYEKKMGRTRVLAKVAKQPDDNFYHIEGQSYILVGNV